MSLRYQACMTCFSAYLVALLSGIQTLIPEAGQLRPPAGLLSEWDGVASFVLGLVA